MAYLQLLADHCAHGLQAMSMQPPMQGMQPVVSPYTMELNNAASAAGYWADHLSADEQQRSYLAMQQVGVHASSPCVLKDMLILVPRMCPGQCGIMREHCMAVQSACAMLVAARKILGVCFMPILMT